MWRSIGSAAAGVVAALSSTLAGAQAPPIGQGGAAPGPPFVARGGHQYTGGPTPTVSGCGTTILRVQGSDNTGFVRLGSDYDGMQCQIRFTQPWSTEGGLVSQPNAVCVLTVTSAQPLTTPITALYYNANSIFLLGANGSQSTASPVRISWFCAGTVLPP